MVKKVALGALVAALIAAFFILDLQRYLTLESLKQSQESLAALRAERPFAMLGGFFAVYVAVTALSLPGAAIMTLAAGALFGLLTGTVLVSFASSIGATLAFLVARYVLRSAVKRRFAERMAAIDAGVKRDGGFYLFTLRLVPIFPFFIINLAMGLTAMKTWTFYWVSQVGMLAGTIVYVNAGTQLAQVRSLGDILSPELIGSFVLLGIFPWIARKIGRVLQTRRAYARWKRPKRYDRNLVVIGAGAAGLVSAYIGAAVKAKVTLIEAHKMGGDCLNYGCVPSKALIKSARVAAQIRRADRYGLQADNPRFDFKAVMARVHDVIAKVEPHDSVARYEALGVEVLQGHARIVDPWTVEVKLNDGDSRTLKTRAIVIAAGAEPFVPPLPGLEDVGYVTSDTLWTEFAKLDSVPRRLVVLGGGPIGCELAQAFARLGAEVAQVEMLPRIMAREDEDIADLAKAALEADGVRVLTGHKAIRCERAGEDKLLIVSHDGTEQRLAFDALVCAVGRKARLKGYGLEALGIPTERTILTNDYLETLYPNIYAAGDVAG
ncbi:MAG: pyridine nucleotide-disulfide oxidoreductase, partial [Alphaproteobacteria bacterium]